MTTPRSIACVVGARPNLVKMAPILKALARIAPHVECKLVHTGQHYDEAMSEVFFRQLGIPAPAAHLEVGSGSQGQQTSRILARFEDWLVAQEPRPDATLVVGDVNSTMACALASVKLQIPVIHVEAGLRSFDRGMPEEINRIVTDSISDLLLVSEPSGIDNLRREGRPETAIELVGNVMIDALYGELAAAKALGIPARLGVPESGYALWTMHRPANVDDAVVLAAFVASLVRIAQRLPVVFPMHPRTESRLKAMGLYEQLAGAAGVVLSPPLGYQEFLGLSSAARVIITDSGGLQEESTVLGIPCLTLRPSTERPITVSEGTSMLVGSDATELEHLVEQVLAGQYKRGTAPALWDGHAADRIAVSVARFVG